MYVDIVISNVFNLNLKKSFSFLLFQYVGSLCLWEICSTLSMTLT